MGRRKPAKTEDQHERSRCLPEGSVVHDPEPYKDADLFKPAYQEREFNAMPAEIADRKRLDAEAAKLNRDRKRATTQRVKGFEYGPLYYPSNKVH
jgi:hypothetical protein